MEFGDGDATANAEKKEIVTEAAIAAVEVVAEVGAPTERKR